MENMTKKELDRQLFADNRKILNLIPDVPKDGLDQFALDFIGELAYANRGGGFGMIQAKAKLEAIREMNYDAIRDAAAASPEFKMRCLTNVHAALNSRWKSAGEPEGAIELCLWEMTRHIDNNNPGMPLQDSLLEGVEILEDWASEALNQKWNKEAAKPLTADESEAIRMARVALATVAPAVKKPAASMGV